MARIVHAFLFVLAASCIICSVHGAFQMQMSDGSKFKNDAAAIGSRRLFLAKSTTAATATALLSIVTGSSPQVANAAQPNGLKLNTSSSTGLKWADAKVGTGQPLQNNQFSSIDYSIASTAGRFPKIYSTKDTGAPYRWKLGDGSTIKGIELAILGAEDLPPMLPGGIRRVIVPASLGYETLRSGNSSGAKCLPGGEGSIGPIPPKDLDFEAYQRWYSFYCNPRIPYQPDLVLDIKFYGKR